MADLILHHYPNSPFSEKVRIAFGVKQLAWKSVVIPNIMPKPELMPLTGGYRKTPVMQVGADIYCDTQLIMLEIERRAPKPPLLPVGQEGEARALAIWIDRNIFWSAVGVVMGALGDQLPEAFRKDRSEFSGRPFNPDNLKAMQPIARDQTYAQLTFAEQMLRDGRPFLLGAAVPSERAVHFLAWDGVFEMPLVGKWIKGLGVAHTIKAKLGKSQDIANVRRTMSKLAEIVGEGHLVTVFPEGNINHWFGPGGLKPFRTGAVRLAARTGVPIVPVGTTGEMSVTNGDLLAVPTPTRPKGARPASRAGR